MNNESGGLLYVNRRPGDRHTHTDLSSLAAEEVGHVLTLNGGVSGAHVYLLTPADSHLAPKILKLGHQVGQKEADARGLLGAKLPLPNMADQSTNHTLHVAVPGVTIEKAVREQIPVFGGDPLSSSIVQFDTLWQETWSSEHVAEGYPQKIQETKLLALNTLIQDDRGAIVKLGDTATYTYTVNGQSVGTLESQLRKMEAAVGENSSGTIITHGDEGANNAIISPRTGNIIYIDYGEAGRRRLQEPIAKVLMFFLATAQEGHGYRFSVDYTHHKADLTTRTYLPRHIVKTLNHVRKQFEAWVVSPYEKQKLSAFIMMYLLREFQHSATRGRPDFIPHLLATAMEYSTGIDGTAYKYPVHALGNT